MQSYDLKACQTQYMSLFQYTMLLHGVRVVASAVEMRSHVAPLPMNGVQMVDFIF